MLLAEVDEHVGRGRCGGAGREAEMRGARAGGRGARVQLAPVVSGQPLGCRCWCAAGPWGRSAAVAA